MATVRSQAAFGRFVQDRILTLDAGDDPHYRPRYGGIVVMEDKVLVTDKRADNLQIYNRLDGKLLSAPHGLVEGPTGVCIVSSTEVAVCLVGGKIVIMSLESIHGVKPVKTFDVSTGIGLCHSVAKWRSDKLLVSGKRGAMLCWCLVSLEDGSLDSTHDICKVKGVGSTHMAVKDDTLYVSCRTYDSITDGVYAFNVLNPRHEPKFLYQHQELKYPGSIMADRDYVFVSDRYNNTIHQITMGSGQLVTIHRVSSSIYGMFYDDHHGLLYTTSWKTNEITVYKMEYPHQAGIPVEILNMDDRSIQLFEEALKDGKETIYNIRIMVCGCLRVGKSTLVSRLLGEKVNISERHSTEGIDVHINCCNVSLLTKEWIRQEKDSEQDYKLKRLVKVLNENYQTSGSAADQEQAAISHQTEKTDQNPIEVVADFDKDTEILNQQIDTKDTEILYQRSQQNIGQNLSSTASHQGESISTDVQRNHNQPDKHMIPGKGAEDIHSAESHQADPLRKMLTLLKENKKAKLDVKEFAQLSIWDFAGQCAFYTTHQMFLTRRAIYLLVADVSGKIDDVVEDEYYFDSTEKVKYKGQELVEIWMNSIHSCAPSEAEIVKSAHSPASSNRVIPPPVILVGTHVDQIPQSGHKASKEYEEPQIQNASIDASNTTSKPTHSRGQVTSIAQEFLQKSTESLQRKQKATGRNRERNIKRRKGREREAVIPIANQNRVTCADPNLLYQVLYNSTPDAFPSRSTLERNFKNMGLQIHGETPGNGNCFFEAVSSQLRRINHLVQRSPQQLRQDAVAFLKANQVLQLSTGDINFAEFMCNESFQDYCARMEHDSEWADHVLVVAMARTLQRDIMIVTSSPSSGSDDIVAWVVGQDNFQENPILLGHIWEQHYESLEPIDSDIERKQVSQPVKKMDTFEEIRLRREKKKIEENRKLYRQKRGLEYLKEIRFNLRDKPVICHFIDEDFALDNSIVDERLDDLKTKIFDVASQQPHWGEQIPTRWFLLEQQLMSLRDAGLKVISHNTVEQINKEGTVQIKDSEELDLFLKYLHETGTIIYFSIEILRDNIILDPKWLIDALKTLINAHPNLPESPVESGSQSLSTTNNGSHPRIPTANAISISQTNSSTDSSITQKWSDFKEKGILSLDLVDAIWTKDKHPDLHAHKDHLLKIMEQFNIIAKPMSFSEIGEKVEEYYLVPCMLRQESPSEVTSLDQDSHTVSTSILCCVFRGKYLPPPIFHRLIAACIARWPVAKKKGTSEHLIFCGSCVFDIDLFHRLTLHFRNHIIYARITKLIIDDLKTLDARLCTRVRKFVTLNLSKIISYLGQNLQYELRTQIIPSQCVFEYNELHLSPEFDMWFVDEGHDPDMPITPEHIYHARLCIALVSVCAKAMRNVLSACVLLPYKDVYEAILANRDYLMGTNRREKLLNSHQIQLVFPSPPGPTMGSLEQFDLSLLYTLIRNVSSVQAPSKGWGKEPQDHPSRDTSLGASVERIRQYRNLISGHSSDGKKTKQDLQDSWNNFEEVLHDIEAVIGGTAYSQELKRLNNLVISVYEAC